jgi:glycosyltransferase involved in cell wall biosynthesis
MMNVIHIITGLGVGGAEMTLLRLLATQTARDFKPSVISLREEGVIGAQIQSLGIPVYSMNMQPIIRSPLALINLSQLVKRLAPDLIQGWMYHGNLAATLVAYSLGLRIPLLWNIRQSLYELKKERILTRGVIHGNARLSGLPKVILYNSQTSALQHEAMGFKAERRRIIPNGFDCEQYRPDSEHRYRLRQELGFSSQQILIGLIARYHPIKDHANFLKAAARLMKIGGARQNVVFILAGRGVDASNGSLVELIHQLGLRSKVHLLGERSDIPHLMAALDIATLSSAGESFSNVIGEAMACGVPCVATDVGDSAAIIADTGRVVPPKNPHALAAAWQELLAVGPEGRQQLGHKARCRITNHFSLLASVRCYENLYWEMTY